MIGAMDPIYLLLEVSASLFFIGAALAASRRGRLPFLELVSAATFGILLEEGDQLVFQTYHYSSSWMLTVDRAPVVIGLTWALIIAGAMRLTDALGVRRRYAPFVDSVLAISLDLGFDAIAIQIEERRTGSATRSSTCVWPSARESRSTASSWPAWWSWVLPSSCRCCWAWPSGCSSRSGHSDGWCMPAWAKRLARPGSRSRTPARLAHSRPVIPGDDRDVDRLGTRDRCVR